MQPVVEMDGAHFQKLCRDCNLLGRHLSTTDVDLIFAKAGGNQGVGRGSAQLDLSWPPQT